MFRLDRIVVREIRMDLKETFRISSGVSQARRIALVEVVDADGAVGWGECVAGERPNYSPETIDTAWLALREWIAPVVVGRTFENPQALARALDDAFRGHRMAKACVEMASWDLAAMKLGVSLAGSLGGARQQIATGISLGIQERPSDLADRVGTALAAGYRRIKVKIAPGADEPYIRAAREAAGPDAPIMADANGGYRLEDAERLQTLDPYNLMMIEQPLGTDDLLRHAELQRQLRTPLCLDESITSPDRAADMIHLGSGRIINIKAGRVGGLTAALAIHDIAAAHAIPVWCGGMLESGIGRAHNVALASLPNFTIPGDVSPSSRYWHEDIVAPEWTMADGLITVPFDRPGLGVEVNRDRLEHLTVHQEVFENR